MATNVTVVYSLVDKISKQAKNIEKTLKSLEGHLSMVDRKLNNLEKLTGTDLVKATKKYNKEIVEQVKSLDKLEKQIKDNIAALEKYKRQASGTTKEIERFNKAVDREIDRWRRKEQRINRARAELARFSAALGGVTAGIGATTIGLSGLNDELDRTGRSTRGASRDFDGFNSRLRRFLANGGEVRTAFRNVMDFSFFRSGVLMGLNFFEAMTKILGIAPLVSVAIGGIASAVGSLGTALLAAGGSLGRLLGGLALLPGLYAAFGAASVGMKGIMGQFITPSVEGAKKLGDIGKQISKAQKDLAASKAKTADPARSFGESRNMSKTQIGRNTKEATDELQRQKDLQQQINDLQGQYSEELEKMPSRWAEISGLIESIKQKWQELWQGGTRGKIIQESIIRVLTAVNTALNSSSIKRVINEYARLSTVVAEIAESWLLDPKKRDQLANIWIGAIRNLERLIKLFEKIMPYIVAFFDEVNWFTGTVLDKFIGNIDDSSEAVAKFKGGLHGFLSRSITSWGVWLTAIIDVAAGIKGILTRSNIKIIDRFEGGLTKVTERFREWATGVDKDGNKVKDALNTKVLDNYFEGSMKILGSLGNVIMAVVKALGMLVADPKAAEQTARFFNLLAGAIDSLAGFMIKAIGGGLGEKMNDFLVNLGKSLGGTGGGVIRAMERVITLADKFVTLLDKLPPEALEWILTFRLGFIAIGLIVGQLLSPLARFASILLKVGEGMTLLGKGPLAGALGKGFDAAEFARGALANLERAEAVAEIARTATRSKHGELAKGEAALSRARTVLDEMQGANEAIVRLAEESVDRRAQEVSVLKDELDLLVKQRNIAEENVGRAERLVDRVQAGVEPTNKTAKGWSGVKDSLKSAFKFIGKIIAILAPLIGAAMAIKENFMGAADDIRFIGEYTKRVLGPSWDHLVDALTGGGSSSGGGFLGALDKGMMIMGKIVTKSLELVAVFTVPFLSAFIDGLAYILDLVTAIYDLLNKVKIGSMGLGELLIGGLTAVWTAKALWGIMGGPIKSVAKKMGAIFFAETATATAGGAGAGAAGGRLGGLIATPMGDLSGKGKAAKVGVGAAGVALSALAIKESVDGYMATWEAGMEGVEAANKKGMARSDEWQKLLEQAVSAGSISPQGASALDALIEQRDAMADSVAKDVGDTSALEKVSIGLELFSRGSSVTLNKWKAEGAAVKKAQDDIEQQIKDVKFDLGMEGILSEVDQIMLDQNMLADDMAVRTANIVAQNVVLAQESEDMAAAMFGVTASIGLGVLRATQNQKQAEIAAGEAFLRRGEIQAGNVRTNRVQELGQLVLERGFDPATGAWSGDQGLLQGPGIENRDPTGSNEKINDLVGAITTGSGSTARPGGGKGKGKGKGGGKGGPSQDAAVSSSYDAASLHGYAGTDIKAGAILKFSGTHYETFVGKINKIHNLWKAKFSAMGLKVQKFGGTVVPRGLDAAASALNKHAEGGPGTVVGAAIALAEAIAAPFEALFGLPSGSFYTYLREAATSANSLLVAAGSGGISAMIGGVAITAPAGGDSNRSPTTAAGGGSASMGNTGASATPSAINGSSLLSSLDPSIQDAAKALLDDHSGAESVTSARSSRPGNPGSQHPSGMAMDIDTGSIESRNAMGRWVQANAEKYGVNPGQVFYPARPAETAGDHNDHVHIGFGGSGSSGFFGADMSSVPGVPDFGAGAAGRIATGLAEKVRDALVGLGGSAISGGGIGYDGDLAEMVRSSATAYGANAEGLLRVANAESTMDPYAWNRDDTNALAGTPSRGLFQFIESTFESMSAQAYAANNGAWMGVNRTWLDPQAQALTAAWAFTHGQGSHWATAGEYGDGGHFKANRPTPIIVGDKQPEEVRVTPLSGSRKGKFSGGKTTVINSTVNLGTLIATDDGIEQLTEVIGMQFRKDLKAARNATPHKDE